MASTVRKHTVRRYTTKLFVPSTGKTGPRKGKLRCTATAKRTGKQCSLRAMPGVDICQMHGAPPISDLGFPMESGARSEEMFSKALAPRYAAAKSDPDLMNLRNDLVILEVRLTELLERAKVHENPNRWSELHKLFFNYKEQAEGGGVSGMAEIEEKIRKIFDDESEDYAIWEQIFKLIEQRRKIEESEQKRLIAMSQMISAEDVSKLVMQLLNAIKRNVVSGRSPDQVLEGIVYEFEKLTGGLNQQFFEGGENPAGEASGPGGLDQEELLDPGTARPDNAE